MGGSSSRQAEPLMMSDHHQQFPDLNMVFKGLPKMMQVADDMHRMTEYMGDLRNMMLVMMGLSLVGVIAFLLLKYVQGRRQNADRRHSYHYQEERPSYRQYASSVTDWTTSQIRDPEKGQLPTQMTPSTVQHNNQNYASSSSGCDQPAPNGHIHQHKRLEKPIALNIEGLPYVDNDV